MTSLGDIASAVGDALGAAGKSSKHEPGFQNTRVVASFHSDQGFDGVVDWKLRDPKKPPPFHIVGLATRKLFGAAPGYWALTVKAHGGRDLMRLWDDPEDVWARIAPVQNGSATEVVFGPVSTITETVARGGAGERSAEYVIEGLDFQKVFAQSHITYNLYAPEMLMVGLMMQALKDHSAEIGGNPGQIVGALLQGWLGDAGNVNKQWMLPKSLGGGSFYDLLEPGIAVDQKLRGSFQDASIYRVENYYGSSLWELLGDWSNGVLNEMYCCLDLGEQKPGKPRHFDPKRPPRPRFVLRERPFPSKGAGSRRYSKLRSHRLELGDVALRQISKGAPESRFNYWALNPQGTFGQPPGVLAQLNHAAAKSDGTPGSYPIFGLDSISRHGLRQFVQSTHYLPYDTQDAGSFYRQTADWLHLLHDWYGISPYELAGSITTSALRPEVQIGERVTEARRSGKSVTYYVEGVSHQWQFPGPGRTTLNVTRGEYEDRPLLDLLYQHVNKQDERFSVVDQLFPRDQMTDDVFPGEVPHGSGPRLDKQVGQIEPPELVYLRRRGIEPRSRTALLRGELREPRDGARAVRPGDLPDRVSAAEDLAEVAPPVRSQNGGLSQQELEQGVPFPVGGQGQAPVAPSRQSSQDALSRRRGRVQRGGGP